MKSLYAKYLAERTDDEILETAEGFATYRYINGGKTVYIVDIFTTAENRKAGYAAALADIIAKRAKEAGATEMIGTVVPTAKGSTISMRVLLGYGMDLASAHENVIVFRKGI